MASFDAASKKQVETNPQDFVDLCFRFGATNITVLEVVTPEQPTVEMHQADILIKALDNGREVLVHFEFQTTIVMIRRCRSVWRVIPFLSNYIPFATFVKYLKFVIWAIAASSIISQSNLCDFVLRFLY